MTFLSATWTDLLILSYRGEEKVLQSYLPSGLELDRFDDSPIISLVSFRFQRMTVLGVPVLGAADFVQVNLRFYVRRRVDSGWRPGVVFIKELCPSRLAALGAKFLYRENYLFAETDCSINRPASSSASWRFAGKNYQLNLFGLSPYRATIPGSIEHFILDRYYGYSRFGSEQTAEFAVTHIPWKVSGAAGSAVSVDGALLYGEQFRTLFEQEPLSALMADGSAVKVGWRRIRKAAPAQESSQGERPLHIGANSL